MTPSTIELPASALDHRVARFAACATAAWMLEAVLPSPLPGVKPGLANVVVLIALHRVGLRAAIWVALLRVFAGGLLLGTLFSPGFMLGFAGSVASCAALAATSFLPRRHFGPVTHSVVAALAHIGGQLALARLWLIPDSGLGWLVPMMAGSALLFGVVNGLVAARFLRAPNAPLADAAQRPATA